MYVISYLNNLSSKLVLSTSKKKGIGVSIGFLKVDLNNWSHSADILKQQVFGSYDPCYHPALQVRRKRQHESREDNPELCGRGEQDGLEEVLGLEQFFLFLQERNPTIFKDFARIA